MAPVILEAIQTNGIKSFKIKEGGMAAVEIHKNNLHIGTLTSCVLGSLVMTVTSFFMFFKMRDHWGPPALATPPLPQYKPNSHAEAPKDSM
jgi:hypothetical protein